MTVNLVQGQQEAACVLGGYTPLAASVSTTQLLAWRDAFWSSFRTLMLSSVTCTGVTVRATHEPSGVVYELGAPASPAGAKTGSGTIPAGATLIKWATDTGGRSGKGRTYLPGLSASDLDSGGRTYVAAHSTATATAISNYLGHTAFSGDLKPAVLSFRKGAAYVITSGAIAPIVGIQRRRMR